MQYVTESYILEWNHTVCNISQYGIIQYVTFHTSIFQLKQDEFKVHLCLSMPWMLIPFYCRIYIADGNAKWYVHLENSFCQVFKRLNTPTIGATHTMLRYWPDRSEIAGRNAKNFKVWWDGGGKPVRKLARSFLADRNRNSCIPYKGN